ncbi:hypothetical protein GCM10009860_00610 [Microbacterium mitrae]|uniref:DUF11 domain-containing protein n=1 Tax=Microbacterium mitrae TaxID=664640 RepID=A0A5C8HPR6_9MICO|nr:DUF11 domain-containing protein [Microbacterium mitrae]
MSVAGLPPKPSKFKKRTKSFGLTRTPAITAIFVLIASLLAVQPAQAAVPTPPAGGFANAIDTTVSATDVLAGGKSSVSVSGKNANATPDLYNGSVVVILPHGVTYDAGSTSPPDAGAPQILEWIPDPAFPDQKAQVLVWPNVADLPTGSSIDIDFTVTPFNHRYPVGSTIQIGGGLYANSDERRVPRVTIDANGQPVVSRADAGGSQETTASVLPIELKKSEKDPELEVYRGPANAAEYELTVTAATAAGTDDVVVVDLLPADFQLVECASGDFPCTSRIVEVDGEVFTELTWNLERVGAGEIVTLNYTAFIGLNQITAPGGVANGAPTRPAIAGDAVKNTATTTGVYSGAVAGETPREVTVTDSETVTVLDTGVVKSVNVNEFVVGGIATYSLSVRSSEYVDSSEIVLVDRLPDGLCPLLPAGVSGILPTDCPKTVGVVTGGTMTSAVDNGDDTFTITFDVADLAADEDVVVTYQAFMRDRYSNGFSTSAGDTFPSTVELTGVTDPATGNTVDQDSRDVENGSSASLATSGAGITKTVWSNPGRQQIESVDGASTSCAVAPPGEFVGENGPLLQLGDLVCFRIKVDYPTRVATRNAVITDFLPDGAEMVSWAVGPGNNVANVTPIPNRDAWITGARAPGDTTGPFFTPLGSVLVLDVLMRVTSVPTDGDVDLTGNLAKLRYTDGAGNTIAARDDVDISLAPPPPLALDKKVNGQEALTPVVEGQQLNYTLAITNNGTTAVNEVEVWDVLPTAFACDDLIVPANATCADGRITWTLSGASLGPDQLFTAGETLTLAYTVTVPTPSSIGSTHQNQAAVTRYEVPTTDGTTDGSVTFYPENPVSAYPNEDKNAPQAADTAHVTLPGVGVAKTVVKTSRDESGNNLTGQATIGETVTYQYSVTVPGKTSVFRGILSDTFAQPSQMTILSATASAQNVPGFVAVPSGSCTNDDDAFTLCSNTGALAFPVTWTNESADPAVFTVFVEARVTDINANRHNANINNTARFHSTATAASETLIARGEQTRTVTVVEPAPTILKRADKATAAGGDTVTYTLTAANTANRSPAHSPVVVDCVPGALQSPTWVTAANVAGPVPGNGTNGCATGTNKMTWTPPNALTTAAQTAQYTVVIPAGVAADTAYLNTATVTAKSHPLADGTSRDTYTKSATATVRTTEPRIVKDVVDLTMVPGETATWTIQVTVPKNVVLYNAVVTDTFPAGFGSASDAVVSVSCDAAWTTACVSTNDRLTSPANVLAMSLGTIAAAPVDRVMTFTVKAKLQTSPIPAAGNRVNTAQLRWNSEERTPPTSSTSPFDSSRNDAATTTVRHPQLAIAKSVTDDVLGQTDRATYSVTATNSSQETAYDAFIVDTVPAGIVILDGSGTPVANGGTVAGGGIWNATARTLTWTVDSITPGASVHLTYSARLDAAAQLKPGTLTNSVRITEWNSLDGGAGSKYGPTAPATETVTPKFPYVSAAKSQVTLNPVVRGQEVTFRVVLTNAPGADIAQHVSIDDVLPAGWSYKADSAVLSVRGGAGIAAPPTIAGQKLTWNNVGGDIALGANESVAITYVAIPGPSTEIGSTKKHTNTVTITEVEDRSGGTSYDGGTGKYQGPPVTATAVINSADLQITKEPNDDFVAGGTGSWTLTVKNNGTDPAVGVSVSDVFEPVTGVQIATISGEGWACTLAPLQCSRPAAEQLAAGAALPPITVTATIAADVAAGTEFPNTATVSGTTDDPTPDNNTSTGTGIIEALADLAVTKRVTAPAVAPVMAGEDIAWSITLTNRGPSVSRGSVADPITLTDPLPAQVKDVTLVGLPTGADCSITDGTLTCLVTHDMALNETITINLAGKVAPNVTAGTNVVNEAKVTPGVTNDPDDSNDSSTTTTPVAIDEDLTISKSIIDPKPPANVVPGETVDYQLVIGNRGPSTAREIWVTDVLPAGATLQELLSANGWSLGTDPKTFVYDGELAPGGTLTLTYRIAVDSGFRGELTNTATVSSTHEPDQDTSSTTTGSSASADLEIVKTVQAASVIPGGAGTTYTLTVTNKGPSDSQAPITVTDRLPGGMTLDGVAPQGCTPATDGDRITLTCERTEVLAADDEWVITIPVKLAANVTATTLDNTAVVDGTTTDPNPDNDEDNVPVDVTPRADISVSKVARADTVDAGAKVKWDIVVTNNGPSDAQNVTLTDALPAGLYYTGLETPDGGMCHQMPGTLECALGALAPGESKAFVVETFVWQVLASGDVLSNTATVNTTTVDPVPSNNTSTDTITVTTNSVLSIEKTAERELVAAGDTPAFQIAVTNEGPSAAAVPVTISDTLPDGLTLVAVETGGGGGGAEWQCAVADQLISCVLTDGEGAEVFLPVGAAPVLRIVASTSPSEVEGTRFTNVADATSGSTTTPVRDTADVVVTTKADLGIEKSHDPLATATAGLPFEWTLTVTNHGPSDSLATAEAPIMVADQLPAGVSFAPTDPSTTTCVVPEPAAPQSVQCAIPSTIPAGESVVIKIPVMIAETAKGDLTNTATVTESLTPQPEDETYPDEDTDTVTITEVADLTVVKTASASEFLAGTAVSWTIAVTNRGPSNSDATPENPIRITDAIPSGVTDVEATGDGWTCAVADGVLECVRTTDLPVGAAPVITVNGMLESNATGVVENTAVVTPDLTPQPDGGEPDSSTSTTPIVLSADVSVVKDLKTGIIAGKNAAYTLLVHNAGPSDATDVVVVDTLPDGLTFVSIDETDVATCADASGVVTCTLVEPLVAGASETLTLHVAVDAGVLDDVTNVVEVTTSTPDPEPGNNEDEHTGTTASVVDLSITKTTETEIGAIGSELQYTLSVANAGPSVARGVVITDPLPESLTGLSAVGDDWSCVITAVNEVSCLLGELAPGETAAPVTVTVRIEAEAYPEVSNTATVESATPEDPSTLGDNTSTETIPVAPLSNLTIVKTAESAVVAAGTNASFLVEVTNHGPNSAETDVVLTDTLPAGLTFVSAETVDDSGAQWACDAVNQLVTCVLTDDVGDSVLLPIGDAPVLRIVASTSPSDIGDISHVNVAQVTSPSAPGPVEDDATVTVVPEADLGIEKTHTGTAVAGSAFEWTFTVTNHGPSDSRADEASPIIVRDELPAGVSFAPADASATTCVVPDDAAPQVVECAVTSTIAAGESVVITMPVLIDQAVSGELSNTATVTESLTPQPEEQEHPDESTDTVIVDEVADLTIVKSTESESFTAGTTATWTITVTNLGPSNSDAAVENPIVVTDVLPAGVTNVTASGDGWTCEVTDGELECARTEDLPVGAAPVITMTGTLTTDAEGELSNTATVVPDLTPQPEENEPDTSTVITPIDRSADLSIVKELATNIVAGENATYTLQVHNAGPSIATDVVVVDTMPAGLTFIGIDETDVAECVDAAGVVTCTLAEPLAAGESATLTMQVAVAADVLGDVVNTATVSSTTPDPNPENNTDDATGPTASLIDLAVVKSMSVETGVVGSQVQYELSVTNAGPSTAQGVALTDVMPAGLTAVSATGEGWVCVITEDNAVSCLLGELAPGATAPVVTITAAVEAGAYPEATNTASVTAATPEDESTLEDNSSSVTIPVAPQSALTLTKSLIGTLVTGRTADYVLVIGNEGATEDLGPITLVDELPAGLTFVSAQTADGTDVCEASGQTVTCVIDGPLAAGERVQITMTVAVADTARGVLTNTATVTSEIDPEGATAEATATVEVTTIPVTGGELSALGLLALPLVVIGGGLLLTGRRRRTTDA